MVFKDFVDYSLFYEHSLLLMRVKERIGNVNFCYWVYNEAEFWLTVTTPSLSDLLLP